MNKKYTVLANFIIYIIFITIVIILIILFAKEDKLFTFFTSIIIAILILVVTFNDYKIVFCIDKIRFYKLMRKSRDIEYNNIIKIEIEKARIVNRITGSRRKMIIYTSDSCYSFNIHELQTEGFYKDLNVLIRKHKIRFYGEIE